MMPAHLMKRTGTGTGIRRATILAGFAVSASFLALAAWRLDRTGVQQAFAHARWWPFVPLAIACYVAGHVLRGVRCRELVRQDAHLSTLTASNIVVVGYAVNNLLPARLGELARAGMLAERTGMPFSRALTVTFLERLLDGIVMVGLLIAAPLVVPVHGWVLQSARVAAPIFGVALVLVVLCALAPYRVISLASRLAAPLPASTHDRVVGLVSQITQGVSPLRDARRLPSIVTLSVLVWLAEAGMFVFAMSCFHLPALYGRAVVVMAATNLGILLPSSPGFIGPFHWFCMQALAGFGVPEATSFSYAVLVHLTFYAPVTLWGVAAMGWYGIELGTVLAMQRAGRLLDPKTAGGLPVRVITPLVRASHEPAPSRLLQSICEALLPDHDLPDRAAAVQRVCAFVAGQTAALPWYLRLAMTLGLSGFSMTVLITHARPFSSLPLARRRRIVAAWAWGRLAIARQLFRPLRSTALLAWYEDAAVSAATDRTAKETHPCAIIEAPHG